LIFDRFIRRPATEKERGREIRTATEKEREEERSVTHAHRPATEKDRGRENRPEYAVFRQDLSLYAARERYRAWVSAGNPENLARSGLKPRRPYQIRLETHAHRRGFDRSGTPSPVLSPVVPISPFRRDLVARVNQRTQKGKTRPFRLKCRRIAFYFTLKVVVWPAGVHEGLGFTFATWGSEGLYAFNLCLGNMHRFNMLLNPCHFL
jgi:hypothetical protein